MRSLQTHALRTATQAVAATATHAAHASSASYTVAASGSSVPVDNKAADALHAVQELEGAELVPFAFFDDDAAGAVQCNRCGAYPTRVLYCNDAHRRPHAICIYICLS